MYMDDSSPLYPYTDDSYTKRSTGSANSRGTHKYSSPKDSTRFNDYDMADFFDTFGSPVDNRSRTSTTRTLADSRLASSGTDETNVSLGFDSYIRAIAKPAQMPPALPAPPNGFLGKDTNNHDDGVTGFDFGLQSFLRTMDPEAAKREGSLSSSTRRSGGSGGPRVTSSSGRARSQTQPVVLGSPIELLSLSGASASTNRRSVSSRSTPTPLDLSRRNEEASLLERFLSSTRQRPKGTTPVTSASPAPPVTPGIPFYPRTTQATPLVMGTGYLDSFLDQTTEAKSSHPARPTGFATRRTVSGSPTDTETEPCTPFLGAADTEARAGQKGRLESSVRSGTERGENRARRASYTKVVQNHSADEAPTSASRRSSKRPPSATAPATPTPAPTWSNSTHTATTASSSHGPRSHTRTPSVSSTQSASAERRLSAARHTSPQTTPKSVSNAEAVFSKMADHPVSAAVRGSPAAAITLFPPLSPTVSVSSTRRRISDTSNNSVLSDHSASRGGSLPAVTPQTSLGGPVSPGSGSITSDTPGSSGHRRMARPKPVSSVKEQQAMVGVAVPTNAATELHLHVPLRVSITPRKETKPKEVTRKDTPSENSAPSHKTETPPSSSTSTREPRTSHPPASATTAETDSGPTQRHTAPASPQAEAPPAVRASSFSGPPRPASQVTHTSATPPASLTSRMTRPDSRFGSRPKIGRTPLRMRPLPLQDAPMSILSRVRLFDPKAKRTSVRRVPRRSLPNGKRRADWVPPVTSYTATLHEWCGHSDDDDDDQDGDSSSGEDIPIDALSPSSVTSSSTRQSYPTAIMVDEVDKKRLIASEENALLSPALRAGGVVHGRRGSVEDVVRVSRSFDGSTPLYPSFFKANSSIGSDSSPPPSRSSRRPQTPLMRPGMTPLDLAVDSALPLNSEVLSPLPQVSFGADVEDIPF